MSSSFDFHSLDEDIQVEIIARLASSCDVKEILRFSTVSPKTNRLCQDREVLRRASLRLPHFPWAFPPLMYTNYVRRCCAAGNTLAIYRVGLLEFFHERSDAQLVAQGLNRLARAADEGLEQARKMYGLILICLGGEHKQKGFRMLSPFVIPLIPQKVEAFESYWRIRRNRLFGVFESRRRHLLQIYVREKCSCTGLTSRFFTWGPPFDRWGRFEGIPTTMACEYCLWHEAIQLFCIDPVHFD